MLTIAKPTSAFLRAGPSLVPSPVTATTCLCSNTVLSMMPTQWHHHPANNYQLAHNLDQSLNTTTVTTEHEFISLIHFNRLYVAPYWVSNLHCKYTPATVNNLDTFYWISITVKHFWGLFFERNTFIQLRCINWSKWTVKKFIMLQKIYILYKYCSLELFIHQSILKK